MYLHIPTSKFGRLTTSLTLAAVLLAGGAFAQHAGARSSLTYDIDQLAAMTGAVSGATAMPAYDVPALRVLTARVIADIGEDPASLANLDANGVRMFMRSLQVVQAQIGPFPSSEAVVGAAPTAVATPTAVVADPTVAVGTPPVSGDDLPDAPVAAPVAQEWID
jgi:hypothetical protein